MKAPSLGVIGLQMRFALARLGWINAIIGILLLTGIIGWLWWLPHLRQQYEAQQNKLLKVSQALRTPAPTITPPETPRAERNLADFYDALGESRYAEQQVKTLFAIANKTGLVLTQGEYKAGFERDGRFHRYQILLPVKGTYGVIRQFCQKTLKAIPFASLDDISFKRDNIANRMLEAKLHFTLYLSGPTPVNVKADMEAEGESAAATASSASTSAGAADSQAKR